MPASTSYEDVLVSMSSSKLGEQLKHQFRAEIQSLDEPKLLASIFSFQARLSSSTVPQLIGEKVRSSNIATVVTEARNIPDIVRREDVLSLSL